MCSCNIVIQKAESSQITVVWCKLIFLLIQHINKTRSQNCEYEYIIIIVIMLCCQHGFPWPSLTTRLYRPLLPGGLPGYILYRHSAVVCRYSPVVQTFLVHVKGSTGVYLLWVRPYFSSMSSSSKLDGFSDLWLVGCGLLPPGLVQYSPQHSCVIAVKLFLHTFSYRPCSASI